MDVTIRPAALADRGEILALVRKAFTDGERDGQQEVDIVLDTWARDASPGGLEIIAIHHGTVVGHVLASRCRLGEHEVLGVAPLAVAPAHQGNGIGSALMRELIERAERAGRWPLVALLGSPQYYSRFGFEPSGPLGITYRPVGAGDPHFQVRRLSHYDASHQGDFVYCWEDRTA